MKLNRSMLLKAGIVAAVVLIIYLIWRSSKCKDTYATFTGPMPEPFASYSPPMPPVRDDEYAENMFEADAADYAEEGDEQIEEMMGDGALPDYAEEADNFPLLQSTIDDDEANTMFEPEM